MATQTPSSSTNFEDTKKRKRDNSSCSEEDEKIITSSSPSSLMPPWKHDVFLSFYGKDTRNNFMDHLFVDLKRKGILVFSDDETLNRGKCISQELMQAIQESKYAIVIFSTNYTSSKWCLMELAEIVEWEKKTNLTIIPIFYHVDPSDVRNLRGTFAEAFTAHEKDPKVDIKEIDTWRNACRKVSNIAGEHILEDRYESTIIQKISGIIFYNYTMLNILIHDDDRKLVGINSRVEEMMKKLHMESNDVRFLGIHGMGGVGKTTLAEIIYYRASIQFEGSTFISCIREDSRTCGLASLQKQLLSMIMQEEIRIWDHHQGIMVIRTRLQNKKVLIILDDVDSLKQLMALVGNQKWFGPGSRVIITCRDSHLLITHGVNDIYKVELLQTTDALQLFSLSAFKQTHPIENYKEISMDFVNYTQGLPLALKVLGSFLFGRTIDAWKSARDQLEAIPNKEVMDILQISFDGLEESQQKLFLDVACFPQASLQLRDSFKEIYPAIDIEVLVDKSLINKSEYGRLSMYDLLKKMGQEIVRRECPKEPGRRSRLFRVEDVYHMLKNDTVLNNLKYLDLSDSENLIETPNLTEAPNLEKIYLAGCESLCEVHPSIGLLKRLKHLSLNECLTRLLILDKFCLPSSFMSFSGLRKLELRDCKNISIFPSVICSLLSLEILRLYGWSMLEKFPDLSRLECLKELRAYETAITQIPSASLIPKSIRSFNLEGHKRLPCESKDLAMFINDYSLTKQSSYPTYDIGSPVEYEMEEIFEVEALQIQFYDMLEVMIIHGWSFGSRIPEWVQNKSNGSSVRLELDGDLKGMGCAIFIVCDCHQFNSPEGTSISSLFKVLTFVGFKFCLDDGTLEDEFYKFVFPPSMDIYFDKPIVFWAYKRTMRFFECWKSNNLDKQNCIKISITVEILDYDSNQTPVELEVKEWGMHLVCPDDAGLGLGSALDSYGQFYSAWKCGMHDKK
ncbi:disease resistance protein RPV1-like [Carya illinoinensis]|uniref:disease resistance protein RPV1-like n=1 Tax=Carya illinoinensis TaxID=32201 RepID=UPI001C719815|nr:disease resistance protein RPV1-like [Carya illinoinensis]